MTSTTLGPPKSGESSAGERNCGLRFRPGFPDAARKRARSRRSSAAACGSSGRWRTAGPSDRFPRRRLLDMRRKTVPCVTCRSETRVIRTIRAADGSVLRRHQCTVCHRRHSSRVKAPESVSDAPDPISAAEAKRPRKHSPRANVGPANSDPAGQRKGGLPVGPISIMEGITINVDFLE